MDNAPLHEKPLSGDRWSRPWHLWFDSIKRSFNFLNLTDTPDSYSGQAGKVVKVKIDESGLEFGTGGGGVTDHTLLTNIGVNTHAQLDSEATASASHRAETDIHRRAEDIDHGELLNSGTLYTHADIENHIDDTFIHVPSQSGHSGKYLTTNGTVSSWATVSTGVSDHTLLTNIGTNTHAQIDTHIANTSNPHSVTANQVLPSQGGNSGKYLTTDGTNSSWATVSAGVSGSGTTNTIPLWSSSSYLSDSALSQSSGNVTCSGDFGIATGKVFRINSAHVLSAQSTNLFVGLVNVPSASSTQTTIIGNNSGKAGFAHIQDVFIGDGIGTNVTTGGGANTVIGAGAGADLTTGVTNLFAGAFAGSRVTTGSNNIFLGPLVGNNVTTGSNLIAIGRNAMSSNVSGSGVVAIGESALQLSTASNNIGVGPQSLQGTTTAPGNIGIGFQSGFGLSTGTGYNTCIGSFVGPAVSSTANYGIHLGALAGYRISGGVGNIFIGGWCGFGTASYSIDRTIIIGNDCMRTVNPSSDRLYIDVTSGVGADTLIYGEFNNRILKIHGRFATRKQTLTLGAGVTTFAIDSNILILTGDAGTNTIATITGGVEGMYLFIRFTDANITMTKDTSNTANTLHLKSTINSTANHTVFLFFDGNKWFEP